MPARRVVIADTRRRARSAAVPRRRSRSSAAPPSMPSTAIARVEAVTISGERMTADCLLVSGGFTPTVHLYCQARGKLRFDEQLAAFVPGDPVDGVDVVGAANGTFAFSRLLAEAHAGRRRYRRAAAFVQRPTRATASSRHGRGLARKGRQWIDFQNDVTVKDIELAARENFPLGRASEALHDARHGDRPGQDLQHQRPCRDGGDHRPHHRRYRHHDLPAALRAGAVHGRRRPPSAASCSIPVRRLALENAAPCRRRGLPRIWRLAAARLLRQRRRPSPKSSARQAGARYRGDPRRLAARQDRGAGAATPARWSTTIPTTPSRRLKPGRIRYGFMLTEAGVVYDDGVVSKVSDQHYIVSCSSGHVAGVAMRLEEWRQDRFDPSRVVVHNSTAALGDADGQRPSFARSGRRTRSRRRPRRRGAAAHGVRGLPVPGQAGARRARQLHRRSLLRNLRCRRRRRRRCGTP